MTEKQAKKSALFVGLYGFLFTAFVFWQLFKAIGPDGAGIPGLELALQLSPFVVAIFFGIAAYGMASVAFDARIERGESTSENSEDSSKV
jgi:apolipoprotein N-acyltransferase